MYELTVRCDCENTIRLPVSKPPQEVIRQMPLTTGGLPKNVLCPDCKHVSSYSPDRFRKKFFQNTLRDRLRGGQVCACIRMQCGEQGCISRVNIRMAMRASEDMKEDALSILGEAIASNVVCESGHPMNGNVLRGVLAVLVDPGWESLDWNSIPEE